MLGGTTRTRTCFFRSSVLDSISSFNSGDGLVDPGDTLVRGCALTSNAGDNHQAGPGTDVFESSIGIDEETMAHLFEPFFTTKPMGEGTGLGLSTVYGIVTQAGGQLSVNSQVGEGAEFKILLPLAEGPAKGARSSARLDTEEQASGDGHGLRG